ncbi:MAG: FtsK/SpoIIIE domain-containing protein [Bifidobacterium pullorum]|uniref:FtsK/SpoIIIE domain-containing protein n=1 Tax=Bifidobacterium pullorum TaxID=78448 RepID=UPI003993A833
MRYDRWERSRIPMADTLWVRNTIDGSLVEIPMGMHTLIAGRSGAGKSQLIRQLIRNTVPDVADGYARLYGIDLKGGVELARWAPWMQTGTCLEYAIAVLEDLDEKREQRNRMLVEQGLDKVEVDRDVPLLVLVVDELAELAGGVDKTTRAQQEHARALLDRILRLGRAAGITVVAASQDPRKESIPLRDRFPNRIALALGSRDETVMMMGEDAVRDGCAPHAIPATTPGVGYWHDRAHHRAVRFRCPYQPGL